MAFGRNASGLGGTPVMETKFFIFSRFNLTSYCAPRARNSLQERSEKRIVVSSRSDVPIRIVRCSIFNADQLSRILISD